MRIVMHINYCEQGQSIEETCRKARAWGFDGVEFRSRSGELSPEEYLDRIAAAFRKEGLQAVHFGGGPDLNHRGSGAVAAAVAEYLRFYELALQRFDLTVCNLQTDWMADDRHPYDHYEKHGSALATDEIMQCQVTGLRHLADFAGRHGFRFALETHPAYVHDLPAAVRTLIEAVDSPALGATFDYGNIIGFPDPPSMADSLAALGDKVFHVHVKNSLSTGTRFRQRCALAEGEINHRELLRLLRQSGYRGNICLESPRKGDREHFAASDAAYFRSLQADLL